MTKWGLSATIKAPVAEILEFVAYHLELGAHRLYIYLDEPNPEAFKRLKAHPKVRVRTCDDDYWRKMPGKRPDSHQPRQVKNATHAYARRAEVDWLIHMDVDEYLWPDNAVEDVLKTLPTSVLCARVRPIESIAGDGTLFKGFIPSGPDREAIVNRLYPKFGHYMRGGFLSHVAGKLFVRTGLTPMTIKIHNAFLGDEMNPGIIELEQIALCHCHAKSWDQWIAAYRYRLNRGSYRADLPAFRPQEKAVFRHMNSSA